MYAGSNQAGEMSHIDHNNSTHPVSYSTKSGKVYNARVCAGADNDHLSLIHISEPTRPY